MNIPVTASTAAELRTKIGAYKLLFDREPHVFVYGTIRPTDGEMAFLGSSGGEIVGVGRSLAKVRLRDGETFEYNVNSHASLKYEFKP